MKNVERIVNCYPFYVFERQYGVCLFVSITSPLGIAVSRSARTSMLYLVIKTATKTNKGAIMKILLLEPGYSNKYPPLGLMKIATFHNARNDQVIFAKGKVRAPQALSFCRVYINTLFTFEWPKTCAAIEYAHSLVAKPQDIYVGGILATLMPNLVADHFPGVNVITGLLNQPGKLGIAGDESIDYMPPCYDILDQIAGEYSYPAANAYFAYTTRGCGMNCSFCAVKTLEPEYIPHVSIREQILAVQRLYGNTRDLRNLLLMDNNVLKSPQLRQIVDEIKELGFAKGARYINPVTKKEVNRSVDFNQGLDANLLTQEKAEMLAELELRPVRIAFDHIADRDKYVTAVERCVRAGLRSFSNYMLYNTDDASSYKGKEYRADTPEDLYERLVINIELQERFNQEIGDDTKVSIYSFPMRYIPLQDIARGYIGVNWNAKFLRTIQVMLNPTQGKGIAGRDFFSAAFGSNIEEFQMNLLMPEAILLGRGNFVENKKAESDSGREERRKQWLLRQNIRSRWLYLFGQLMDKQLLCELIADNHYSLERLKSICEEKIQQIYLYYFSESQLLDILQATASISDPGVARLLLESESVLLESLQRYIQRTPIPLNKLRGYFHFFNVSGIEDAMRQRAVPASLRECDSPDKLELKMQWEQAYEDLQDKSSFIVYLNEGFDFEKWSQLSSRAEKLTGIHYFDPAALLELLGQLNSEDELMWACSILRRSPWQQLLGRYVYSHAQQATSRVVNYLKLFGESAENYLVKTWFSDPDKPEFLPKTLERALIQIRKDPTRAQLLGVIREYWKLEVLDLKSMKSLEQYALAYDTEAIRNELKAGFSDFRDAVLDRIPNDATTGAARATAEGYLERFYQEFLFRMW